jgi:ABC-type amino acid transport substrate-binding protein
MHSRSIYALSVLGAGSAMLCFAVALAVPAASWGPKSGASLEPGISDTVNRASKGDRLRVIVRPPDAAPFEVHEPAGSRPKSLDGCESVFGPMDQSSTARLAQSCVT